MDFGLVNAQTLNRALTFGANCNSEQIMSPLTTLNLPSPTRYDWTVSEFEKLFDLGFFAPDARLELINGQILKKMSQNETHSIAVILAQYKLMELFARGHVVRVQLPLIIGEISKPEPDLAVVTGAPRDYLASHPTTAELVIEISDATLRADQTAKAALYARAEIAEYWIVNLVERTLEVRRQPSPLESEPLGYGYRSTQILLPGESIAPLGAATAPIGVNELLP